MYTHGALFNEDLRVFAVLLYALPYLLLMVLKPKLSHGEVKPESRPYLGAPFPHFLDILAMP